MSWILSDNTGAYTFDISPSGFDLAYARKTLTASRAALDDSPVVQLDHDDPIIGNVSGTLVTSAEYTTLLTWWAKSEVVHVFDDLGNEMFCLITAFAPKRKRSVIQWNHDYTLTLQVLAITDA